ncbi:MAG: YitT family protein [Flavobacteriaceae bacterium]
MNPFVSKLLIAVARKRLETKAHAKPISNKEVVPLVRSLQVELTHAIKESIFIIIGVFSAGFGLKGFLLPNRFIDGGATGISLLLENITNIPLGYLLILVNLPFLILGARTFNLKFALVLAIYLSRKLSITVGDVLLLTNIIIFSFGAYVLSIETALYAILTYLAAAKTVDFVVDGVEEYVGVTIISEKHEEIRIMIIEKLRRACTIYAGKGGYGKRGDSYDKDIIYTVVTRLELAKLHTEIDKIDKNAFTIMGLVKDLKGGMIKRKPLEK